MYDYHKKTNASFLKWVIESLQQNKAIKVVNDQWNNPTWTRNFSNVILKIIKKQGHGLLNYADNGIMTRYDFALKIANIFDLDTSHAIGDGDLNTQQISEGNQNDNSSNGTEFGSDNYAFKIVDDLNYNGYNDWFIPSSGSMEIIYSNVHSLGLGNLDENLIYWSSTKEGYFPYVMAFNFESWGGLPFPGSCLDVNGLLIARKIN